MASSPSLMCLKVPLCVHIILIYIFFQSSENHIHFALFKHIYLITISSFCPFAKVYLCVHFFVISDNVFALP